MSVIVKPQDELLEYREKLRSWYISRQLAQRLVSVLAYDARTTLQDLKRTIELRMEEEFSSNGPSDAVWVGLFESKWFMGNPSLEQSERNRRVDVGLEPFSFSDEKPSNGFLDRVRPFLASNCTLRSTGCGFVARTQDATEEVSMELRRIGQDSLLVVPLSDGYLRRYLLRSWKYSNDQAIAHEARQALKEDFWIAWGAQCLRHGNEFNQFAFATDAALDTEHYATALDVWTKRDGVLHYDRHPNFVTFDDRGWCAVGDSDPERRTRILAVPDLLNQTRRFHEWVEKQCKRGYIGFSRYYWTEHGVMTEITSSKPVMTNIQLFSRTKLPVWTFGDALMEGLRELHLDQVFFSNVLLSRKEYVQPPS
jgi:hypothetical protein